MLESSSSDKFWIPAIFDNNLSIDNDFNFFFLNPKYAFTNMIFTQIIRLLLVVVSIKGSMTLFCNCISLGDSGY